MAERPPPELSPSARDLLRAFRADESPAVEQRRAGWAALSARLDHPTSTVAAAGRGAYYAKVVGITVALAAGLLLAVKLVGLGVTTLAHDESAPAMEAPYQGGAESEGGQAVARQAEDEPVAKTRRRGSSARSEVAAVEAETSPEPAGEPEADRAAESETAAASAVKPRAKAGRSPGSSSASDLQAELALVKRAHEAKEGARYEDALAALREHARRFPAGTMADERRVLRAEVLCAAGRTAEARTEVQRFLASRAGSALAGRMRAVCER